MTRRSNIDWHSVEIDFRVGLLSVRKIASKHGIADSNLRSRAKREGWTREEGAVAIAAARSEAEAAATERARQIGAEIGAKQAQATCERIEEVVLSAMEVEREHQRSARRAMRVAMNLLSELELGGASSDLIEAEIERCRRDDPARAALIEKLLAAKPRVEAFDRWASAFGRVAAVERQAHGLDGEQKANGIDELLLRVDRERRAKAGSGATDAHLRPSQDKLANTH
jgi:hypothetical protein